MFSRYTICRRLRLMWPYLKIIVLPFFLVAILFFVIFHFLIIAFLLVIFVLVLFFPWLSSDNLSWHFWVCRSNEILVCLHLLFHSSIIICACISCKSIRNPYIGILCRGDFFLLLKLLVLIVRLFSEISPKACHRSSQYLEGSIYHIVCLLWFQLWFVIPQVSSIVCES